MILRLAILLACLAVAACGLETGPPDNEKVPRGAPMSALPAPPATAIG